MNPSDASPSASSARDDLAFMRAVAEDRGPLPPLFGAHIFAVGAIFGANILYAYAGNAGLVPWPRNDMVWSWAPAAAVYALAYLWLHIQTSRRAAEFSGPAARAFAAVWSGVMLATAAMVAVVWIASERLQAPIYAAWPAMALGLYGAAWAVIGIVRKAWWMLGVTAGCFASAVACAFLIGQKEHWLAMGAGLLLFMAVPGWIVWRGKRQTS
jgi:peptidoglycan/LPS O-acetylase OafA/YrhL